jgi:CPA2 family monovalent cation:H+ antiporter-2
MHDAHEFLRTLAVVLCVAAVTTVVFQRLRQPVVFGYLLAGMIVGPHIPIPLVADEAIVETLSELGVILLLFSLGLEFSLRKLLRIGPTAGLVAVAQSSGMVWIGYVLGQLLGWTTLESVFAGAVIAISSTTIIAKAFEEQRVKGRFTEIVFGVLIIEDLIGIFLIAILTTVATGTAVSASSLAVTGARLATFLAGLIGVGLLVVPRTIRAVVRMNRPETTLVASIGICFAAALLALSFGYSVALGAFIAGSLVAESGEEKVVEHLVQPVRDVFAAIFFVSVGVLIDPAIVAQHWGRGARVLGRGHPRQAGVRDDQLVPHRLQPANVGAGRHEPRADRRVLVHHRGCWSLVRRHTRLSVPGRGGRLGDHDAHDAVADPGGGAGRGVGGSQAAAPAADVRVAVRVVDRADAAVGRWRAGAVADASAR